MQLLTTLMRKTQLLSAECRLSFIWPNFVVHGSKYHVITHQLYFAIHRVCNVQLIIFYYTIYIHIYISRVLFESTPTAPKSGLTLQTISVSLDAYISELLFHFPQSLRCLRGRVTTHLSAGYMNAKSINRHSYRS